MAATSRPSGVRPTAQARPRAFATVVDRARGRRPSQARAPSRAVCDAMGADCERGAQVHRPTPRRGTLRRPSVARNDRRGREGTGSRSNSHTPGQATRTGHRCPARPSAHPLPRRCACLSSDSRWNMPRLSASRTKGCVLSTARSTIVRLFLHRCPAAVAGLVVAVVVLALDSQTWRSRSHVGEKVLESAVRVRPALTDADASTAVLWIVLVVRVAATCTHRAPR